MKVEIQKVDREIEKEAAEETFGIELIPENEEEHGILRRFWDGGVKVNGYSSSGDLQLTFADLIKKP